MRRRDRVPLALFAGLALAAVPLPAEAEPPSFIPPPLGASDIPGATPAAELPAQLDLDRQPATAPQPGPPVGSWARADGDRAIDTLLRQLVGGGQLPRLARRLGRRPVIRVAVPAVRTAERVDGSALSERAAALLRRSGQVVVAAPTDPADALLLGYLGAFADRAGRLELRSYLVGLSLVDLVTGEKLWVDGYRVRRLLRHQPAGAATVRPLARERAVDLSGRLADHDALEAATRLAAALRRSRWLARASAVRVRLYPLHDRTGEAFRSPFLTLPLERALIAMPAVTVLAGGAELAALRGVPARGRPGVRERRGAELGATHVLRGTVTRAVDRLAGQPRLRLRTYTLGFEAIAVETHDTAWAGTHAVKKLSAEPVGTPEPT